MSAALHTNKSQKSPHLWTYQDAVMLGCSDLQLQQSRSGGERVPSWAAACISGELLNIADTHVKQASRDALWPKERIL